MNICITGAAGFIGSHLVEFLLQKKHVVIGIDNCLTGNRRNIQHLVQDKNFTFIQDDVISYDWHSLPPVDIIFHLASPASPVQYKKYPVQTLMVNSLGTKNMLDYSSLCRAVFVYASTSEVYGDPLVHPQTENYWGNVNPNGFRSCYDEAKRFGEALCMSYVRSQNAIVRIARIFNTFGPHMGLNDGRVISNFITQALQNEPITVYGSGSQTRSFCYVSDLVEGLWLLAIKSISTGEVINLGNPHETTIKEIAQTIKHLTQSSSSITQQPLIDEDDPKRRLPDITKASQLLGWKPVISLHDGLHKTVSYFKSVV